MSQIIYSGPGKVYFNSKSLHAQGENGQVKMTLEQKTAAVAQAELGRASETFEDVNAKISVTPFDDYSLLATLFPKNLGVSTPALTGALKIGAYAHDASFVTSGVTATAAKVPLYVWCADGSEYFLVRGAITKHPDIMLGASTPLFGSCEFTCIGDSADPTTPLLPGASGYLFAATPMSGVYEPSGSGGTANADPDASFAWTNFIRERWTGDYGPIAAGTGTVTGLTGFTTLESEDSWTISVNAKYSPIYCQKILMHMKLDSVEVVAKAKIVGPTHSQILATMLAPATSRLSGSRMANQTYGLQLTSATGKKVTLNNCELKGAGITTGGTNVRAGEVGFVSAYTFTTPGTTDPILTFA